MNDKWTKRWKVASSSDERRYWVVAQDAEGGYGCSCPVWKFKRQECHHIKGVKAGIYKPEKKKERPKYVLACVTKPTLKKKTNELFVPLVGIPDAQMMEATICFYLLKHGYSWGEIKGIRRVPHSWTMRAVLAHVERYGEAEYPEKWYRK